MKGERWVKVRVIDSQGNTEEKEILEFQCPKCDSWLWNVSDPCKCGWVADFSIEIFKQETSE